ncbi:transposase [Streptomyces sp. LN590]|uniref:transposase n=1 Tax=unclassified Streptomyces TaxID=2593676 RepID=UPI0037194463
MGRGDLTNGQWARLEPLLPQGIKPGRPPAWTRRQLIDGVRWRTRTGAPPAVLGVSRAFENTSAAIPAHPVPTTGPLIRQLHRLAQPPSHQSCPELFVTAGPRHRAVVAETAAVLAWGRGAQCLCQARCERGQISIASCT